MKASSLPKLATAIILFGSICTWEPVAAQDSITPKSGPVREGKIVGVSAGNVRIQTSVGSTTIPLKDIAKINMDAPPEFDAAATQLATGNAKAALTALQKLNDNFAGLPTPWAQRAAVMLADAKLETGDTAGAKAGYEQFARTYPQATTLANLGMARLAIDAGDTKAAESLLAPLVAQSAKSSFPSPADGSAFSQAHYLMGRIRENAGDLSGALKHYLEASAVFPFDRNAAAAAQKRADELRAEHAGLIAP